MSARTGKTYISWGEPRAGQSQPLWAEVAALRMRGYTWADTCDWLVEHGYPRRSRRTVRGVVCARAPEAQNPPTVARPAARPRRRTRSQWRYWCRRCEAFVAASRQCCTECGASLRGFAPVPVGGDEDEDDDPEA